MIKFILILITSLLIVSACSSSNKQLSEPKTAPAPAALKSIENTVLHDAVDSVNEQELLKKSSRAPSILINIEDDDMPRLD